MFNKNKKIVRMILALSVVLSMVIGTCTMIYAEEREVPTITIKEVPLFTLDGVVADATATVEVPEGYQAVTQWMVWDEEAEEYKVVTDGTFTETDVYKLTVLIETEDGYRLADELNVVYPDDIYNNGYSYNYGEDDRLVSYSIELGCYTFTNQIQKIDISTPEVKAGNVASLDKCSFVFYTGDETVDENNVEIDCKWINETTGEDVSNKTFENETSYQFDVTVKTKTGYSFAENVVVYINGEEVTGIVDPCHMHVFPSYPLYTPVEHVHLENVPEVKVGAEISTDIKVECHCEQCEIEVHWHDEEENDITDDTFVAGKTYILCIHFNLFNGATFTDDFVFMIGDKEYKPTELEAELGQAILELKYVAEEEKETLKDNTSDDTSDDTSDNNSDNSENNTTDNKTEEDEKISSENQDGKSKDEQVEKEEKVGKEKAGSDVPVTGDFASTTIYILLVIASVTVVLCLERKRIFCK